MKIIYRISFGLMALLLGSSAKAQIDPLGAQYYSNQYIVNPAFAGMGGQGLKVNAAYRKLWSGIDGAPLTQNVTADYGFKKVGIGLNVNNESAGLLKQTRVVGSYAYHLRLDSGRNQLSFGLSLGLLSQRLEQSDISGNPNDVIVGDYNGRETYLDGDFGVAYSSRRLTLQVAVPNLKSFFRKDVSRYSDVATFFTAASYRFGLGGSGAELEPKVVYRGVKGFDNLLDIGAQAAFAERRFLLMGMYHSNQSATLGLGLDFRHRYLISGMYTTQTSALSGYTNGSFELNIRIGFGK